MAQPVPFRLVDVGSAVDVLALHALGDVFAEPLDVAYVLAGWATLANRYQQQLAAHRAGNGQRLWTAKSGCGAVSACRFDVGAPSGRRAASLATDLSRTRGSRPGVAPRTGRYPEATSAKSGPAALGM